MKILVSDKMAEEGLDILRPHFEVVVKTGLSEAELVQEIPSYSALMVRSATKVTAPVIEAGKNLKVIARAGVGVDNVDLEAATHRGIVVVNSPGGNTIAACEHTIAMMLALARRIAPANASIREGKWDRGKFMGVEVYGKTLGIIGVGKIGAEVAKRAHALGMDVLGHDPYLTEETAERGGVRLVPLEELLRCSDYVTLHCPHSPETHHLLDQARLHLMKKGVRVVNVARGGIVDEAALVKALDEGHLAGAAIDVFAKEPPEDWALARHEKVLATPHLGASTEEAQTNVAIDVAEQVVDILQDRPARSAVNMPAIAAEVLEQFGPYLNLAIQVGLLLGQVVEGAPQSLHLEYSGEISGDVIREPISRSVLMGLLRPALGDSANVVNAPVLAKARGLEVSETVHASARDYASLLTATVGTAQGSQTVSATVFARNEPRIVQLEGYRIDMIPSGDFVLIYHRDRPGLIGQVGTITGAHGINIAGMLVGREAARGRALMVLQVDDKVPPDALRQIEQVGDVYATKVVRL
jgi:D-3-phosphoglycerate dehydrogenase